MKKDGKITFKDLWNHPGYNALIKLGMWLLFFIVIYVIIFINNGVKNNYVNNNNEVEEKITYLDIKNNLINNKQNVIYKINDYYITGEIQNNILNGTLEDNLENLYKIKYDGIDLYQIKKDEETINNELLTSININYLLPKYIMDLISDPKVIGAKSADEKEYSYNIDNKNITVYLEENNIKKIIILDNGITYELEYSEVKNEVKENN